MKIKPAHRDILLTLLNLHRRHEEEASWLGPRTVSGFRRRIEREEAIGFRYRAGDWFGRAICQAESKRLSRAIDEMVTDGWIEWHAAYADRRTHLKLTRLGRTKAEALEEETATEPTTLPEIMAEMVKLEQEIDTLLSE